MKHLKLFEVTCVPMKENSRVDLLSKITITENPGRNKTMIEKTLIVPNVKNKVVNALDTLDAMG